jgi:SSS family solute:Na+ symporter
LAAFLLGETLIPPYANRALASKTTKISRNGFILAGIFSAIWFMVMVSLGITARSVISMDTAEDLVLLNLVKSVMPASGYALLLVVLVSVIMSSLDSLLNAGAVTFTEDIVKPFVKLSNGTALNTGRIATVAIAIIAAAGAVVVPSIIDGLLLCYTIWAPAILPALMIGLWVKQPRPLAGILSMGIGTVTSVTFEFVFPDLFDIPVIIVALGAALVAYMIGHWVESAKTET